MALTKPLYNQLAEKLIFIIKSEDYKKIKLPNDIIKLPVEIRKILTLKINDKYINIPFIGNINIELAKTMLCAKQTKEQPLYDSKTQNIIIELEKQICKLNEEKKKVNTPEIIMSITRKTEILTKLKIPKEHKNDITPAAMLSIAHQIHEIMFKSVENAEKMYNIFVDLVQPINSSIMPDREFSYKQDNSWKKIEIKKIEHKKYDTKYVPKINEDENTSKNINKYVPPTFRQENSENPENQRKINVTINDDYISLEEIYKQKINVQKEENKKIEYKPDEDKDEDENKYKSLADIIKDRIKNPRPIVIKTPLHKIEKVPDGCILIPEKNKKQYSSYNYNKINHDEDEDIQIEYNYNEWIKNANDYYYYSDNDNENSSEYDNSENENE